MESTIASLNRISQLLGKTPPATVEAIRELKELLVKTPCSPEVNEAREMAERLLTQLIKPAFSRDREKQAVVARLLRKIQQDSSLDLTKLTPLIREIAGWMQERVNAPPPPSAPPPELIQHLMALLHLLAREEPWLAKALKKMDALTDKEPRYWSELHALLSRIVTQGEIARSSWENEQLGMQETLAEASRRFREMLQTFGPMDGGLHELAKRVETAGHLADIEALTGLLLHEAGTFLNHARVMDRRVATSLDQLSQLKEKVRKRDEAWLQSRDEQLTDPFTALPNRFAFGGHLKRYLERAIPRGRDGIALILVGIGEDFQRDWELSREELNLLLSKFAKRMRQEVGQGPVLARLDELVLVVLLSEAPLKKALEIAQKIATLVKEERFALNDHKRALKLEASFGVVGYEKGLSGEGMLGIGRQRLGEALAAGPFQIRGSGKS
ncbi:MAG: diguanylate cyclase [Magnetococcales bacterium]|nr:diguanylate cyclase [Magnetococcales bacterium]